MKVLIWFLCIFSNALITTIFKAAGVVLGGVPTALMFAATMWLARTLCKKWDEHKEKEATKHKVVIEAVQNNPEQITNKISFCRKCGAELLDESRFCSKCGTEVVACQECTDRQ